MKRKGYKKLTAVLLTLSLLFTFVPVSGVFAEENEIDIEPDSVFTTPEPVAEEIINDTERVMTTVVNISSKDESYSAKNHEDSDNINQPLATEKPYQIVDILPSALQNNEMISLLSSYDDRNLYAITSTMDNIYNPKTPQELSINPVNGNVSYLYNIASVPGKNGSMMKLDIEYNSTKSKFAMFCADITDAMDYYLEPYISYDADESVGAGWQFKGIKRKFGRYCMLKDEHVIDMYNNYNDYSYYDISGNIITYIDGSKEALNGYGYLEYSEDKYGNRITYTYETYVNGYGQNDLKLKK